MAFEVFDKRKSSLGKAPTVTVQMRGLISLSRAAYSMIGSPKTVELLYDRDEDVVGIRPATEDVPHAYSVRQQGTRELGPVVVAGTAFCQFYDIDTTKSRRWTPMVSNGILCIDLKTPGVEIVGNRRARPTQDSGATDEGVD